MRVWLLLVLLSASAVASARCVPRAPAMGVHGMALVGDARALYASHLPMFHAPHDAQVWLEVRVADARIDRALRAALQRAGALWTLAPERFDLQRLRTDACAPLRRFRADVVEGHFERGGRARYRNVAVEVRRVRAFQPLEPATKAVAQARYAVLPGARGTHYLAKWIDARPDYDHLLRLRGCPRLRARTLQVRWAPNATDGEAALRRALPATCAAARLDTLYFETGDLQ